MIWDARREVGEILTRLGECCISVDDMPQWPNPSDLERLDELIRNLAKTIRPKASKQKARITEPWSRYLTVDHHWSGLRLCERLQELVERACKNVPACPFAVLWQMEPRNEIVVEFFRITLPMIQKEPAKVASVDWERFEPLFLYFHNKEREAAKKSRYSLLQTRLGPVGGDRRLVAYAAYLEIQIGNQAWMREHWTGANALMRWVCTCLRNADLIEKMKCFQAGFDLNPLLGHWKQQERENAKLNSKYAATERKRREREIKRKKVPQKA